MKKLLLVLPLLFASLDLKAQTSDNEKILREYLKTYNQHETDQLLEMVMDDIRIYSVTSDTVTVDIE